MRTRNGEASVNIWFRIHEGKLEWAIAKPPDYSPPSQPIAWRSSLESQAHPGHHRWGFNDNGELTAQPEAASASVDERGATLALVECMRPSAQETMAALARRGWVLVKRVEDLQHIQKQRP
jgi:hypothetical protein